MKRIKIVKAVIICLFLLLGLGIINLELVQTRFYKYLSGKNCIRILPQMGARGNILDREGKTIVDNKLSYDVMVAHFELEQVDKALADVSRVLGINLNRLKDKFQRGYVAASIPVELAKNISTKEAMALEELKIDTPGIIIQPKPIRHYPYGRLASHVLGYVHEIDYWRLTKLKDFGYKTKDIVGFGGVEEKYDYYLRQEEGGLSFEVDHRGRLVRLLGFRSGRNGKDIQLSLDLRIQKIVEEKLGDRNGCVIIMDPHTGEIIALASYPNFDPQAFVERPDSDLAQLLNNPEAALLNRAISGRYPPGSLFKVVVATAGLETKKINSSTTFFCPGETFVGEKKFLCWERHNTQNLMAAITHSCNVFFYKTGLLVGPWALHDYALKFGLSKSTSFDLPYEIAGFVPSPLWRKINKFSRPWRDPDKPGKNWFDGDTANLAIGQGELLVSPIQMTRVMAVFANRGFLVTPYIVKKIGERDVSAHRRKITSLALKTATIDSIRQGLRNAVSNPTGTASVLANLPISVAGKTGTAQAPPGQTHAWFVGFFPFQEPKYVICVLLERGGPGYVSCVLAKQIIEAMISEGLLNS